MTARHFNGRPTSDQQQPTNADPAAPERANDPAPAKALSGAFRAALGKPAPTPPNDVSRHGGKGMKSALNAGPLHGPVRQTVRGKAAVGPRKGHR